MIRTPQDVYNDINVSLRKELNFTLCEIIVSIKKIENKRYFELSDEFRLQNDPSNPYNKICFDIVGHRYSDLLPINSGLDKTTHFALPKIDGRYVSGEYVEGMYEIEAGIQGFKIDSQSFFQYLYHNDNISIDRHSTTMKRETFVLSRNDLTKKDNYWDKTSRKNVLTPVKKIEVISDVGNRPSLTTNDVAVYFYLKVIDNVTLTQDVTDPTSEYLKTRDFVIPRRYEEGCFEDDYTIAKYHNVFARAENPYDVTVNSEVSSSSITEKSIRTAVTATATFDSSIFNTYENISDVYTYINSHVTAYQNANTSKTLQEVLDNLVANIFFKVDIENILRFWNDFYTSKQDSDVIGILKHDISPCMAIRHYTRLYTSDYINTPKMYGLNIIPITIHLMNVIDNGTKVVYYDILKFFGESEISILNEHYYDHVTKGNLPMSTYKEYSKVISQSNFDKVIIERYDIENRRLYDTYKGEYAIDVKVVYKGLIFDGSVHETKFTEIINNVVYVDGEANPADHYCEVWINADSRRLYKGSSFQSSYTGLCELTKSKSLRYYQNGLRVKDNVEHAKYITIKNSESLYGRFGLFEFNDGIVGERDKGVRISTWLGSNFVNGTRLPNDFDLNVPDDPYIPENDFQFFDYCASNDNFDNRSKIKNGLIEYDVRSNIFFDCKTEKIKRIWEDGPGVLYDAYGLDKRHGYLFNLFAFMHKTPERMYEVTDTGFSISEDNYDRLICYHDYDNKETSPYNVLQRIAKTNDDNKIASLSGSYVSGDTGNNLRLNVRTPYPYDYTADGEENIVKYTFINLHHSSYADPRLQTSVYHITDTILTVYNVIYSNLASYDDSYKFIIKIKDTHTVLQRGYISFISDTQTFSERIHINEYIQRLQKIPIKGLQFRILPKHYAYDEYSYSGFMDVNEFPTCLSPYMITTRYGNNTNHRIDKSVNEAITPIYFGNINYDKCGLRRINSDINADLANGMKYVGPFTTDESRYITDYIRATDSEVLRSE